MATKKPVVWDSQTVEISDDVFDSWDEEKEEAAIAEAAALVDVKYIIIEGRVFAGRFPDGTIIKAPLELTLEQIDKLSEAEEVQVDQVKELFRMLGDDSSAEALDRQNLASAIIFATKFFETFERISKAALGKYKK